jgi:hypothetical protein
MKKVLILATCMLFLMVASVYATTTTYPFEVSGGFLSTGLVHDDYYSWGLNITVPANEDISSATITFEGLRNWDNLKNKLFVHILGDAPLGFLKAGDDSGTNFVDSLTTWNNGLEGNIFVYDFGLPYGSGNNAMVARDVSFTISDLSVLSFLNTATSDGLFGLGVDPDCHFWATKLKLTLISEGGGSQEVPEPGTILLVGVGLLGLGFLRKK